MLPNLYISALLRLFSLYAYATIHHVKHLFSIHYKKFQNTKYRNLFAKAFTTQGTVLTTQKSKNETRRQSIKQDWGFVHH